MHARLDLVGDVRDDLHRAAEIVAAALLLDDGVVDAPGGDVGVALHELVDEALVVAQVEVGLGAVLGDEHLAVLVGAHRAGVDVDVGVELLVGDLEAARLEEAPERGRRDALAEPRHHAAGDEDVLGHARDLRRATGRATHLATAYDVRYGRAQPAGERVGDGERGSGVAPVSTVRAGATV